MLSSDSTAPASGVRATDPDPTRRTLEVEREHAERLLNAVRAGVLLLLSAAAMFYAVHLPPALNLVNVVVLLPAGIWTCGQYVLLYRRGPLPPWLGIVNPLVDITTVTAIIGGYGLAHSAGLALRTPIVLAYAVILAARPITSSTRRAAAVAVMVVVQYGGLVLLFLATGRLTTIGNPISAYTGGGVSPLDEGAKLLLLAMIGAISTYATAWHERVARGSYEEAREREELRAALGKSQLDSLKLQLQPHFLFNTLNSIAALIATDGPAAERMVTGLSELLRLSLYTGTAQEVALRQELETLEHYLQIQQIRFSDRLTVTMAIEENTLDAYVPNLILQPVVENAIRHGIAPRATGGCIEIGARRENGTLMLWISDDGVGLTGDAHSTPRLNGARTLSSGVGLQNTRARLSHLYGERQACDLSGRPGGGCTVTIALPYHTRPVVESPRRVEASVHG
ncbi:MAG: histidine kinase [Gemmatimonadota bacterium]|nr:histidine kinase [Gemmatimonadota bacterium]